LVLRAVFKDALVSTPI